MVGLGPRPIDVHLHVAQGFVFDKPNTLDAETHAKPDLLERLFFEFAKPEAPLDDVGVTLPQLIHGSTDQLNVELPQVEFVRVGRIFVVLTVERPPALSEALPLHQAVAYGQLRQEVVVVLLAPLVFVLRPFLGREVAHGTGSGVQAFHEGVVALQVAHPAVAQEGDAGTREQLVLEAQIPEPSVRRHAVDDFEVRPDHRPHLGHISGVEVGVGPHSVQGDFHHCPHRLDLGARPADLGVRPARALLGGRFARQADRDGLAEEVGGEDGRLRQVLGQEHVELGHLAFELAHRAEELLLGAHQRAGWREVDEQLAVGCVPTAQEHTNIHDGIDLARVETLHDPAPLVAAGVTQDHFGLGTAPRPELVQVRGEIERLLPGAATDEARDLGVLGLFVPVLATGFEEGRRGHEPSHFSFVVVAPDHLDLGCIAVHVHRPDIELREELELHRFVHGDLVHEGGEVGGQGALRAVVRRGREGQTDGGRMETVPQRQHALVGHGFVGFVREHHGHVAERGRDGTGPVGVLQHLVGGDGDPAELRVLLVTAPDSDLHRGQLLGERLLVLIHEGARRHQDERVGPGGRHDLAHDDGLARARRLDDPPEGGIGQLAVVQGIGHVLEEAGRVPEHVVLVRATLDRGADNALLTASKREVACRLDQGIHHHLGGARGLQFIDLLTVDGHETHLCIFAGAPPNDGVPTTFQIVLQGLRVGCLKGTQSPEGDERY